MNMRKVGLTILAVLMITWGSPAQMQNYYPVFIYNFTRYIQWPASSQNGDFVIGVLGDCDIVPKLQKMTTTKKVGSQSIKLKVFNSVNEIGDCHMIFIPEKKSDKLGSVNSKIKGSATLVVTEKEGLAKAGSAINFIVQDGKLKFELNKGVAESANLKVSGDLSKLAIII